MKIHTSKINERRQPPTNEQIAQRARQIWEATGRPANRDLDNWLQAENDLAWQRQKNAVHIVRIDPKAPG